MTTRTTRELQAAARIIENLADRINAVRTHVAQELLYADSFTDHTIGAGDPEGRPSKPLEGRCVTRVPISLEDDVWRTCGRTRPCCDHDRPVTLTAVERAAERRMQLTYDLADFDAQCKLIVIAASDAMRSADRILGARLVRGEAERPKQCRDGQFGQEGSIEWGDPTCTREGVKKGLCTREYMAMYRWRKTNGLDTSRLFEPGVDAA